MSWRKTAEAGECEFMFWDIVLILLIGYLIGTLNAGYLIGRIVKKADIRESGSGNAGASNATIVLGWKFGILTAFLDILKCTLAVYLTKLLFPDVDYYMFITGLAVILGHNYPFYMGFKGGKGTASVIGMFIAIDIRIAIAMALTIILITIVSDYIVIGTLFMYISALIPVYKIFSLLCFCILIFLAVLSMYKHRVNFIKIIRKEEIGLRQVINKR